MKNKNVRIKAFSRPKKGANTSKKSGCTFVWGTYTYMAHSENSVQRSTAGDKQKPIFREQRLIELNDCTFF